MTEGAHMAHLVERLTCKLKVVGLIPGLANLTNTYCLLDETLSQTTNSGLFLTETLNLMKTAESSPKG